MLRLVCQVFSLATGCLLHEDVDEYDQEQVPILVASFALRLISICHSVSACFDLYLFV